MLKKIYKQLVSEKQRLTIRRGLNKIQSACYRGNNFTCNLCGRSFRRFKPKGNWDVRPNAECPYCGSVERTRLLLFYLQRETDLFTRENYLLHIAPHWQLRKIFRQSKNIHYTNGDLNKACADEQIDITAIPYPNNHFDYIICSHVLGHVPNESLAIREMHRVLKPEGTALILTLIDWNNPVTYESDQVKTSQQRLEEYSEPDLVRLHGADFADRLRKEGFTVEIINYTQAMSEEENKRYSLGNGDREIIFKCKQTLIN